MSARDIGNGSPTSESTYPVIVGVDGSFGAIRAAIWAAAVAVKLGAPLHIVHARPSLGHYLSDTVADIRAPEMEVQRESATATLQSATRAVEPRFSALRMTAKYVDRPADEVLTEISRTARLVVLSSDDVSPDAAVVLGSTTMAVTAHSVCPVVAWRGDTTLPTKQPIIVGLDHDHDPDSRIALAAAFEFANRLGLGVIAVHAYSIRRPPGDNATIDQEQIETAERQHLSDMLARWIEIYPDVEVTQVIEEVDKPSQAFLRHVADAQMVVVGSRGRGPLAATLLGSTGLNLLHHCPIPVMICRSARTDD